MTKSFTAQMDDWVKKTKLRQDLVIRQSTDDVFGLASRTATAMARGGSVKEGFVPRDTGALAASAMTTLQGSTILTGAGADSYVMVVAQMKGGDTATMVWTAPYARRQHYETGWLWVDYAARQWPAIVRANAARARSI